MAAIMSLKPKETYETCINNLVHFVIPFKDDERTFVGIINGTYREKSLKKEQGMKRVLVVQGFTSNELSNTWFRACVGKNSFIVMKIKMIL